MKQWERPILTRVFTKHQIVTMPVSPILRFFANLRARLFHLPRTAITSHVSTIEHERTRSIYVFFSWSHKNSNMFDPRLGAWNRTTVRRERNCASDKTLQRTRRTEPNSTLSAGIGKLNWKCTRLFHQFVLRQHRNRAWNRKANSSIPVQSNNPQACFFFVFFFRWHSFLTCSSFVCLSLCHLVVHRW